jgi:AcrR family transcriptional regulator
VTQIELTRRERKKEETKERIFQAALKLFKTKGFEATTIDDIAEKADVAKGTFFNYFPRKEAVLAYLADIWIEEAEQRAEAILQETGPLGARMIEMFAEFAAFHEEDPALSVHVANEWVRRTHAGQDETCQRWERLGERVVERLRAAGELRSDVDAATGYQMMVSVYDGTMLRWVAAVEKPFPLKQELRRRLTLVIEGLGPRTETPS